MTSFELDGKHASQIANSWESPYQDARFPEAMRIAGFDTHSITTDQGAIHFYGTPGETLTAWEVDSAIEIPSKLPDQLAVYQRSFEATPDSDAYTTIALTADSERFSSRFMRSVRRAEREIDAEHFHELTDLDAIGEALSAFTAAEHRDDHSPEHFQKIVNALSLVGMARCFVLDHPNLPDTYAGVSVVLDGETQSNLRYYTAARDVQNAGHFLQYQVINRLFADGRNVVDQSGYTPGTTDPKMQGINNFKDQIGGDYVSFVPTRLR